MVDDTLSQLRAGKLNGATRLDLSAGLKEFPREIFDLADTLEVLNLSQNQLSSLPADLARLHRLRILFCSENPFRQFPAVLGECAGLTMIGFKSCRIETVDPQAFPKNLRWLILTDNRLRELPATLGSCHLLQKLMLSGNQLTNLPETMAACVNLELIRLAANQLATLPDWLMALPRLAWLAVAGNPVCAAPPSAEPAETAFEWTNIELQAKIGEGASGIIHRALVHMHQGRRAVAVKVFKGSMTSDGLPACELAASLSVGRHDHLMPVLGRIVDHPEGEAGLVMPLIDPSFAALAGPPSFDSCTRDVYAPGSSFTAPQVMHIARAVASAARHLHERGITHSDLYAHNVLWNADNCLLSDFGAASFYALQSAHSTALQQLEVRAYGCLVEELLARCPDGNEGLKALKERCLAPVVTERPLFAEIVTELETC